MYCKITRFAFFKVAVFRVVARYILEKTIDLRENWL